MILSTKKQKELTCGRFHLLNQGFNNYNPYFGSMYKVTFNVVENNVIYLIFHVF